MLLLKERKLICEYGKKLITSGLTKGTGGNLSIYNKKEDLIAISPSGMDYFSVSPEDIVIIDLGGNVIDGKRKPSVEKDLHRIFYVNREDIFSVIHTHSMYSCILASLNWELPAVNYYIAIVGGKNVRCAKYQSFGTWQLAESVFKATKDRNAAFLANHGMLACSSDISTTFTIAEEVERMSEIYYKTKVVGVPEILSDNEVNIMLEKFKSYGK